MPVLDVGTGVGYLCAPELPVFWRLTGRGRPGEDESGSNGGSRAGAGLLVPDALADDEFNVEFEAEPGTLELAAGSVGSPAASCSRAGGESIFPSQTPSRFIFASCRCSSEASDHFQVLEAWRSVGF